MGRLLFQITGAFGKFERNMIRVRVRAGMQTLRDALARDGCTRWSRCAFAKLGAHRKLHLKGRTIARRRLDPDAATVHLHNLSGDGEAKASAAFGLGVEAVDLMK